MKNTQRVRVSSAWPSIIAVLSIVLMVGVAIVGLCLGLSDKTNSKDSENGSGINSDAIELNEGNSSLTPGLNTDGMDILEGGDTIQLLPQQ